MEIVVLLLLALAILFGVVTLALGIYLVLPLPYPSATESDYTYHRSPWWQIYYSHKYLRPKRRAAKGSGLEGHFRGMDFHFEPPALREKSAFTVGAVGDIMCRKDLVGRGGDQLFDDIGAALFSTDLSIGNLEFPVNPDTYYHKLLRFSVPFHFATPLLGDDRYGRFDALCLANNHINDSFHKGIVQTCDFLDAEGIHHTGANRTAAERDDILIVERQGAKIAILAYSFSTNGIPFDEGREFGTNVVRFNALKDEDYSNEMILRHIAVAKQRGADYIISCHHWGMDLEFYPPPRIVRRTHDLLDAGIDLVIGHHTHVLGPVERYKTRDGRDALVFYSLGNFTSKGLIFPVQRLGAMVKVSLTTGIDDSGKRVVTPAGVEMTPTLFSRSRAVDGVMKGRVLGVRRRMARLDQKDLTPRERWELKRVDRVFRKYFEREGSGVDYR